MSGEERKKEGKRGNEEEIKGPVSEVRMPASVW